MFCTLISISEKNISNGMYKICANLQKALCIIQEYLYQGYKIGLGIGNTNLMTEVNSQEKKRGAESGRGTQKPPSISAMCYLFLKEKKKGREEGKREEGKKNGSKEKKRQEEEEM